MTVHIKAIFLLGVVCLASTSCDSSQMGDESKNTKPAMSAASNARVSATEALAFVKIKPVIFIVHKPFPTIWMSNKSIAVDNYLLEVNIVMKRSELGKVFSITENLKCKPRPDDANVKFGSIEVIEKNMHKASTICFVEPVEACKYLDDLQKVPYANSGSFEWSEIRELARRLKCIPL